MSELADAVLPLIRTRTDLWRWSAANAHGRQMHEAVDVLEAAQDQPPAERLAVCQKAIVSAVAVIGEADDSSGIIGDAVRRLLILHPQFAAQAQPPVARPVDWLIAFQFDGTQDFFEIDPVAYAPAFGDLGLKRYRDRLQRLRDEFGPEPGESERRTAPSSHTRFALDWNAQRLAVPDRDVDAIIATHARDRAVPRWLHATAEAFAEIGRPDLAIDWAKQAADHGERRQSLQAAQYWCALLAAHQPDQVLTVRREVVDRWPTSSTASDLHSARRRRLAAAPRPGPRAARLTTLRRRPVRAAHPEGTRVRLEPRRRAVPERRRRVGPSPGGVREARPDRDAPGPHATRRGTARRGRGAELSSLENASSTSRTFHVCC